MTIFDSGQIRNDFHTMLFYSDFVQNELKSSKLDQ